MVRKETKVSQKVHGHETTGSFAHQEQSVLCVPFDKFLNYFAKKTISIILS
jgi:hypothetical protein